MGREYLKRGFTFEDLIDAMLSTDESDPEKRLMKPDFFKPNGDRYGTPQEAEADLKSGKAIIVAENIDKGLSNMVYCKIGKDGNLAISNSREFAFSNSNVKAKKPSLGRRFAYRALGRFTDVKKRYPDVAEYKKTKKLLDEPFSKASAEMEADWNKHQQGEPVTSVQTMENTSDPVYEKFEKKNAELRAKYSKYIPGVSPIDPDFTAPEILSSPRILKTHVNKRQLTLTRGLRENSLSTAYPCVDQERLNRDERTILNHGYAARQTLYTILAAKDPSEPVDVEPKSWARVAEAQFLQVLLYKAEQNPTGRERQALDYFYQNMGNSKGQNPAWNTLHERLVEEFSNMNMTAADIHKYLETPEGSAFMLKKAESAFMTMGVWHEPVTEQNCIAKGKSAAVRIEKQLEASNGGPCTFAPDDIVNFIMGESFSVLAQNKDVPNSERDADLYDFLGEEKNAAMVRDIIKERFTSQPITETELASLIGDGTRETMLNLVEQAKNKALQAQNKTIQTAQVTKIAQPVQTVMNLDPAEHMPNITMPVH